MDPATRTAHRTDLPRTAAAAREGREFVRRVLEEAGAAGTLDVRLVELLTTELVSNAVEHESQGDTVALAVAVLPDDGGVLVEVRDHGGELVEGLLQDAPAENVLSRVSEVDILPEDGRGLLLVRELSDACGSWATPQGKAAWFLVRAGRPHSRGLRGWWRRRRSDGGTDGG
ncbi:ATP-binding protein [Streptomyces sulphureus]|uniref:ATP-binding protein n=1 Tax=Streptomyces sulphureus TaxID=47758 RepID=UPI001FE03326|nr:ATP-binding protein [Streptomyces sulphureus]